MLRESSKMEQRYDAVLCVIRDGFNVTEVAAKFEAIPELPNFDDKFDLDGRIQRQRRHTDRGPCMLCGLPKAFREQFTRTIYDR